VPNTILGGFGRLEVGPPDETVEDNGGEQDRVVDTTHVHSEADDESNKRPDSK
jgi:hypothetical protein